jgi:H+/gluconate symporter-like permease
MMYPIGKSLFERANISIKLLPGAIALGAFTFTMTALPGTPSVQNSIPSPFFGTDSFAAPGLGLIASCIMLGFGILWLNRQKNALSQQSSINGQACGLTSGDANPLSSLNIARVDKQTLLTSMGTTEKQLVTLTYR